MGVLPIGRRGFLLSAGALAACGADASPRGGEAAATPIALDLPESGPLRPLGALALDTGAIGLGGLSGLHLDGDLRLAAVSDLGRVLTARLRLDPADHHPLGLADLRTGRLRDGAGRPLPRGYTGDAEALARLPDGTWLVGFERWHRIRAYRQGLDGPGTHVEAPPGLERAPLNGGLESLAVLADGRWLAISESLPVPDSPDLRRAWIGTPDHGWTSVAWRPGAPDFEPADATPLPDGGALVLERGFSVFRGFRGRVVRVSAAALAAAGAGTMLEGEELLRLSSLPPFGENWEGIATAPLPDGRLLVVVLSDDNENRFQRTLLLLFELDEG